MPAQTDARAVAETDDGSAAADEARLHRDHLAAGEAPAMPRQREASIDAAWQIVAHVRGRMGRLVQMHRGLQRLLAGSAPAFVFGRRCSPA
jgi:hypothetical protein